LQNQNRLIEKLIDDMKKDHAAFSGQEILSFIENELKAKSSFSNPN